MNNERYVLNKKNNAKESNESTLNVCYDFSVYEFNSWKKVDDNDILNAIDDKGGSIWINKTGALCYRFSNAEPITITKNYKQANVVFSNYLNQNILLIEGKKKILPDVTIHELKMIQSDLFDPFKLQEFFEKDNLYYRNIFKPTKYLQIKANNAQNNTYTTANNKTIEKLIMHLVNYSKYNYIYVINWLAYFFQGLKKSQVALVLRGNQGAGKGILFNEVIKPIFGSEYCMTVNDKSLRSSYLGGIVENKIFFNLDEISHQKAENNNIKNFLKALITNDTITAEKKFETLNKETKVYGQVMITSNEILVLDIEESDRRYTIFTTGDNLAVTNYLGHDTYNKLSEQISTELESFSWFLKSYRVNIRNANNALITPEKTKLKEIHKQQEYEKMQRLQKNNKPTFQREETHISIQEFSHRIRTKDIMYFKDIQYDNMSLYNEIIEDFKHDRIKVKNLLPSFQLLHGDQMRIKYVSILLKKLRKYDPMQYSFENFKKYEQDDQTEDYINILIYTNYRV